MAEEDAAVEQIQDAFPGTTEDAQVVESLESLDQDMMPQEYKSLLDSATREVVNWIPDRPGKDVVGKLIDIMDVESKFHRDRDTVPMLIIESASKVYWGVRCYHSVLLDEVERRIESGRLKIGDIIAIVYLGKGGNEATRDLQQYENYRVRVKPAT